MLTVGAAAVSPPAACHQKPLPQCLEPCCRAAQAATHLCCTEAPSGMRSKEADREPSTAKGSGQGRSSTFTSVAALQGRAVASRGWVM